MSSRITFKSLKVSKSQSQESSALSATVYLDGLRVGTIRNDGRGGDTLLDPAPGMSHKVLDKALAEAGTTLYAMGENAVLRRDLDRDSRKNVVLIDDAMGNPFEAMVPEWMTVLRSFWDDDPTFAAEIAAKHPGLKAWDVASQSFVPVAEGVAA